MRPMMMRHCWLWTAVRAWAILWTLAVPLIHVHPAVYHHHGKVGHLHGGTVHTVFASDLDGEFDLHEEAEGSIGTDLAHVPSFAKSIPSWDHPEFSFSFLNDSTDLNSSKPPLTKLLFADSVEVLPAPRCCPVAESLPPALVLTLVSSDILSRAPPFLAV